MRFVELVRAGAALTLVGAAAGLTGCAAGPSPGENPRGVALFDGRTLEGWTQRGGRASYAVEDGCIVGRTAPNQPNSFLCTERTFRDFDLTLEFRIDPALNSGVQVRSRCDPGYKNGIVHGYQVEIDPSDRAWTGGLYDEGGRGWLVDLKNNDAARGALRCDGWNRLRVRVLGDEFSTWVNDVPVVAGFHDGQIPEGFIALQVHGVGDRAEPLEVRWRRVRIEELP